MEQTRLWMTTTGSSGNASLLSIDIVFADLLGRVSSNLTFSLAPGWRFVESEDWRIDASAEWSPVGGSDPCALTYFLSFYLQVSYSTMQMAGFIPMKCGWIPSEYMIPRKEPKRDVEDGQGESGSLGQGMYSRNSSICHPALYSSNVVTFRLIL